MKFIILFIIIIIFVISNKINTMNEDEEEEIIDMEHYYRGWPERGHYVNDLKECRRLFFDHIFNIHLNTLIDPCISSHP